jgi:hypothetical protein
MAQHDYIIANQSGAAFRSDLNNGLAAIVSNNSGAAQPSTTYAYQWWADTTAGLLKLRNAANNAWITIGTLADVNLGLLAQAGGTLTGALLLDDSGTVSAPALAFDGDTNTGIFRPAADQLGIATNGVERVEFGTTEVVFNDGGADVDFRVEGDTKANLFKVDAGADTVIIDGLTHPSADGSADQTLVTNGSGTLSFASRSRLISGTSVASTSGTSIDFTSIPSWVKRITVMFDQVSTDGSSIVQVQLGDSGGVETTGYLSTGGFISTTGGVTTTGSGGATSGFIIFAATATQLRDGIMTIANISGNKWVSSHLIGIVDGGAAISLHGGGRKELSAILDRVRITTVNGTDTFDAGSINILYEG